MKPFFPILAAFSLAAPLCLAQSSAPKPLFNLADARINELSGMAPSKLYPGHFWAHNDSGDVARLFLVDSKGKTAAIVNLEGAKATDWEDMALAGGFIYVGDIGDNAKARENIQIYRAREPRLKPSAKTPPEITIAASNVESMTLTYPDGPRDAEALAATPDGRLLLVSKDFGGANFYGSAPFKADSNATLQTLAQGVKLGGEGFFTKLATAGDFSPNGRKLLVSTYAFVHEFPLARAFDFKTLNLKNSRPREFPTMKQSESACYTSNTRILVSTEGEKAPVYQLASSIK